MRPDSIIFDVDGTLWDSTPIAAAAWNSTISEHSGVPVTVTSERLKQLFGKPMNTIADILFPFLEEEVRHSLIDVCGERENALLTASTEDLLYPGVARTIRVLSEKYKLLIVSNCQAGYIEVFMEKAGLTSCITDFECPGNTGVGKAENIALVMERNQLKAPVYVGDTEGDRQAAAQAGIPFCFASYGFGTVEHPDYTIREFSELLSIF